MRRSPTRTRFEKGAHSHCKPSRSMWPSSMCTPLGSAPLATLASASFSRRNESTMMARSRLSRIMVRKTWKDQKKTTAAKRSEPWMAFSASFTVTSPAGEKRESFSESVYLVPGGV